MPTTMRKSGPPIIRNGVPVQPYGMLHACETCGSSYAPFLVYDGKRMLSYCGWDGEPVCTQDLARDGRDG